MAGSTDKVMKEEENIIDQVEKYVETSTELYALKLTSKIATVVSSLLTQVVIGTLAFIMLFMISMGLAFWIGDLMGNNYTGFLIIGGVIGFVTLILYLMRQKLIRKPVMDQIISEILK
jgi:Putative Actinobacterial Holin-X, holin superfamily III